MAKPDILNINTSQTFQNWFDKTNALVEITRDSAVTASVIGDSTVGSATITGTFTAAQLVAETTLKTDSFESKTGGADIDISSAINITPGLTKTAATFTYGPSGALTRYTNGTKSWDIGMDNSVDANFGIQYGVGGQFLLSPTGVLTVPSIITSTDIQIGTDLTIPGVLTANTATFVSANGAFTGTFAGDFTGDVYSPSGGKVFENGGPSSSIPATFTGNVNGTVSSLTNHNTNGLTEGGTNLYYTDTRVKLALTGGTGVTYSTLTGDISIGQSVSTTSNVEFGDIDADDIDCTTVTATGTIDANKFTGDGSQLTGLTQLVKGFIAFNGNSGAVISSSGLSLTKTATGTYSIVIDAGLRTGNGLYTVILGNADQGITSQGFGDRPATNDGKLSIYNTFVPPSSRVDAGFRINATRKMNIANHFGGNDNNTSQSFGISLIDPTYITAVLLY